MKCQERYHFTDSKDLMNYAIKSIFKVFEVEEIFYPAYYIYFDNDNSFTIMEDEIEGINRISDFLYKKDLPKPIKDKLSFDHEVNTTYITFLLKDRQELDEFITLLRLYRNIIMES